MHLIARRAANLMPLPAILLLVLSVLAGTQARAADPAQGGWPPKRFFETPRSGLSFTSDEVRRMQADELGNPTLLLADQARSLWSKAAPGGKSCSDCHGAVEAMKGASTRYPRMFEGLGLTNIEGRINACRTGRQGASAWPYEGPELLGMTALIGQQSRGMSREVVIDGAARPHFEAGRALYYQRIGQMNLSCAHCHEQNAGRRLLGEVVSQGQSNAYPIYRLEWQASGSLHRRLRSCLFGVRAELLPQGAPDLLNLELFLAWRGQALPIETPGVRR